MFEIRDLHHLTSIDEFRHFGRAAKAVGLSQPALSKSLQRIERALGAKLFERSRGRVVPTQVGLEVLARARRMVEEAAELQRTVDSMTDASIGTVAVGIGPAMSETYIADAIADFAQRRPGMQTAVRMDHWQQLSAWLLAGELDFYVADLGDTASDRRFHCANLPAQDFVWFCRRGHPLARRRRKAVSRSDLLDYPLATPKLPPWATEWFAAARAEKGAAGLPRPLPAIECESYAMLKRFVSSSDCISAALQQTLAEELNHGSLVVLRVDAPPLTTHAGIVRLADRMPSAPAAELISWIEAAADMAGN